MSVRRDGGAAAERRAAGMPVVSSLHPLGEDLTERASADSMERVWARLHEVMAGPTGA
jgi:hypothetical protein